MSSGSRATTNSNCLEKKETECVIGDHIAGVDIHGFAQAGFRFIEPVESLVGIAEARQGVDR